MSEKEETVKVTVTIELPKKVHEILEAFAKFCDVSLEEILLDQLEPDVRGFYQGEMFQNWIEYAIRNHGVAEYFHVKDC